VSVGAALAVAGVLGSLAYAQGAPVVTAYSHTGVVAARGLAAQGQYVWISDAGVLPYRITGSNHGEKIVRIDVATGATKSITSPLISVPLSIMTSRRYVWVMNGAISNGLNWSLLRINTATLAVTGVKIPASIRAKIVTNGAPTVLAGGYVWISGEQGIIRVNTTTLAVSTITSPVLSGVPLGPDMVADARYVWLSASTNSTGSTVGTGLNFLVRVSMDTGVVTKVRFPGVKAGMPIAYDGTNLWVEDEKGLERINLTTGRDTRIILPHDVHVLLSPSGLDAVENGSVYFAASRGHSNSQECLVRVGIVSGRSTIVSSPFMQSLEGVAAAHGTVWAVNFTVPGTKVRQPVLVRVS
jgi:hypothetical protein